MPDKTSSHTENGGTPPTV